jgi:glucose-6-phosphate dehydrogenase assembly protein OpcA
VTVDTATVEDTLRDLRESQTGSRTGGVRTNIQDLVVVCDTPEAAEEMGEIVSELPNNRPSRAIVCLADADERETAVDARVFCTDHDGDGATAQVCSELVMLEAGDGGAALPSLIAGLLLPDLPVFAFWRGRPDASPGVFDAVWLLSERFVADSTAQDGTLEALSTWLERSPRRNVTDLSWTKITWWRDAVARAFDTVENAECLRKLQAIEVRHVGPSDAQARLMAGWIRSRVDERAEVRLIPEERADMRSGSLTRVTLTCGEERFSVTRLDEGIGHVEAPRIAAHNVPLRVPHLRDLVALELEIFERDETFEDAVRAAP